MGIVDAFPLYVRRPKRKLHRKFVTNGKYKRNCMKFHAVVSFTGEVMLLSGPHPGIQHDKALWDEYFRPLMNDGEYVLGDKGYQGASPFVVHPIKRPTGRDLASIDNDFNVVLGYVSIFSCLVCKDCMVCCVDGIVPLWSTCSVT